MKKTISMILALVMVLGLLPAAVFATGTNNVYISVSFDGAYIDDQNGAPIVYVPVSLDAVAAVDLNEYGLSEYLYDPDGDGNYETTALQLVIYAHENIYGGDWSDVNFTGGAGSSYFQGGIFGFTENLNYFLNGEFPIDEALSEGSSFAVGATSDHIVLKPGDFIDIASFTSFAFLWDSAAGFHLFADENNGFVHNYTAEAGEAVPVKLLRSYSNMADGSAVLAAESGYALSYGAAFGTADGTVTTDNSGCASITFDQAGTYYLWCEGAYGIDADPENIVSSPAYATITVTAQEQPEEPHQPQDVSAVLNATMAQMAATVTEPAFGTTPESEEMTAVLGLPEKINEGDSFNAVISINKWDNEAVYKLIDFIVNVPDGVTVTDVIASDRLSGESSNGQQLPDWSCNVGNSNDTGVINIMYLDMTGGKNAFSRELLAEDYNVVLRLKFRLRGSVRPGDVLDLIVEDAVFAASDELQSLAMTTGTLKTKNGRIVIGEPEDQDVDRGKTYTCTFSIECSTILNNLDQLDPDKLEMVPSGGTILATTTVTFHEGESVFDVLQRVCKEKGIHLESSWTPIYNSAYIEGIHNLYEFDCGALSGWMYRVNGWYPNYGCSRYQLQDGDVVEWRYTCDLGNDVGGKNLF